MNNEAFSGRAAKKSLGQHFLRDKNILTNIIKVSEMGVGDLVLEIGPGEGTLTRFLLEAGATVVAIEKDDFLYEELTKKFSQEIGEGKLTLVHGDILEQDLEEVTGGREYTVVANIPYNITGGIIRMLLQSDHQPKKAALLMQREVAERILARDEKQSLLSLSVWAYGVPTVAFHVSPGSFVPAPKVQSSLLVIKKISKDFFTTHHISEDCFFSTIRTAFGQKRKQLLSTLQRESKDKVTETLISLQLPITIRPEDIPLNAWTFITKSVCG